MLHNTEGVRLWEALIVPPGSAVEHIDRRVSAQLDELQGQLDELQGQVNNHETRILDLEALLDGKINAKIDAITKSRDRKAERSNREATQLALDSIELEKGKLGKLGKGAHGVVRRGTYRPDDDHKPVNIIL